MDLSIIIVSYNTKKLLKECINSISSKTKGIKFEILVVDNASKDGSVELIRKLSKNKHIVLIQNKKNIGFGPANNKGMKKAKGRYFLLLNSDTLIKDNLLSEMVSWMDKNKKSGIVTCALKNPDESLQGTGGYFPTLFRVFSWMFFLEDIPILDRVIKPFHPMHPESPFYKGESFFKKKSERDWITGAFFLARSELTDKVGFFDEDYFMYVEEVDYCYRAKRQGWKVWYLPKWSITHYGGASAGGEFTLISEYKGIKIFYRKHKKAWEQALLSFFLKAGAVVRTILFSLIGKNRLAKIYVKAYKIA